MQIHLKGVNEKFFLTVQEIDGVTYYCLADLMEQLGLKGQFGDIDKKNLPQINSKVCWGVRWVKSNIIESVFVEKECIDRLIDWANGK